MTTSLSRRFQAAGSHRSRLFNDILTRCWRCSWCSNKPAHKGVRATTIRLCARIFIASTTSFDKMYGREVSSFYHRQPRGITHELQRMHDYGVLATYIREFGSVVGRMQYDLFHAYTVDQHTLFVVRNLRCFFVPERFHEFPRCSALVNRLPKPELLYLGGLFHDMAKGQDGDHSEVGAATAYEFCIRHGMSKFDAGVVSWLVKNHLLMSATAQRKDISDPDEVLEFAGKVGDRMHLDYLYLLTVADIRATNPALWNDWKDSLLWDLYQATVRVLRRGAEKRIDPQHQLRDMQNGARRLIGNAIPAFRTRALWRSMGEDYFLRATGDDVAWYSRFLMWASRNYRSSRLVAATIEIFIYSPDKHDLFATACAASLTGLSILDARIITADNGMTLDSFVAEESSKKRTTSSDEKTKPTSRLAAADPPRDANNRTHAEAATQKLLNADTNPISRRGQTAVYRFGTHHAGPTWSPGQRRMGSSGLPRVSAGRKNFDVWRTSRGFLLHQRQDRRPPRRETM